MRRKDAKTGTDVNMGNPFQVATGDAKNWWMDCMCTWSHLWICDSREQLKPFFQEMWVYCALFCEMAFFFSWTANYSQASEIGFFLSSRG